MCQKAFRHFGRGQESDRGLKEILEVCESGETLEGVSDIFKLFLNQPKTESKFLVECQTCR